MALTNKERQARWRERQRAKEAGVAPEQIEQPLTIPTPVALADYVKSCGEELVEVFDWMLDELDLPIGQFRSSEHKAHEIEWTCNVIDDLRDALATITGTLSDYKVAMIDREIERLKKESVADPAKLDANLDTIVRFKAKRADLKRMHRLNLRNYI